MKQNVCGAQFYIKSESELNVEEWLLENLQNVLRNLTRLFLIFQLRNQHQVKGDDVAGRNSGPLFLTLQVSQTSSKSKIK